MTLSTVSAYPLEAGRRRRRGAEVVSALLADGPRARREPSVARRAAGYQAVLLTVDTFLPGWKPRDLQLA